MHTCEWETQRKAKLLPSRMEAGLTSVRPILMLTYISSLFFYFLCILVSVHTFLKEKCKII